MHRIPKSTLHFTFLLSSPLFPGHNLLPLDIYHSSVPLWPPEHRYAHTGWTLIGLLWLCWMKLDVGVYSSNTHHDGIIASVCLVQILSNTDSSYITASWPDKLSMAKKNRYKTEIAVWLNSDWNTACALGALYEACWEKPHLSRAAQHAVFNVLSCYEQHSCEGKNKK